MNKIMNMNQKTITYLAILIFTLSAVFSTGYHHADEHYQIIEFAQFKMGVNAASDLAWEYAAQIRPAIQPTITYGLFKIFNGIGLADPYLKMMLLRILTGLLAVFCINKFVKSQLKDNNIRGANIYLLLSFFLVFLPYINVRYASETYSGLIFLSVITVYFSDHKNKFLFIGLLMGFCFLFRFQTAFLSAGFIAWLIIIERCRFKEILKLFYGAISVLILGILIDYWFYGSLVFTFLNYFQINILQDVASNYGVSSWDYYIIEIFKVATPPIALVIFVSFLILLVLKPKDYIVWISIPFLIVHFATPHKELRFIFPLANFVPYMIFTAYGKMIETCRWGRGKWSLNILIWLFIGVNTLLIAVTIWTPADDEGKMNITSFIQHDLQGSQIVLWSLGNCDPYHPITVKQKFYANRNVKSKKLRNRLIAMFEVNPKEKNYIILQRFDLNKYQDILNVFNTKLVRVGSPSWTDRLKEFFGYGHSDRTLMLYQIVED
ncbi:Alg9-like mannosyltransferase family protein [compost metagenome]